MKIHETIRQRRLAKSYTQEQVANYLGVTAPAINKWEKGILNQEGSGWFIFTIDFIHCK